MNLPFLLYFRLFSIPRDLSRSITLPFPCDPPVRVVMNPHTGALFSLILTFPFHILPANAAAEKVAVLSPFRCQPFIKFRCFAILSFATPLPFLPSRRGDQKSAFFFLFRILTKVRGQTFAVLLPPFSRFFLFMRHPVLFPFCLVPVYTPRSKLCSVFLILSVSNSVGVWLFSSLSLLPVTGPAYKFFYVFLPLVVEDRSSAPRKWWSYPLSSSSSLFFSASLPNCPLNSWVRTRPLNLPPAL